MFANHPDILETNFCFGVVLPRPRVHDQDLSCFAAEMQSATFITFPKRIYLVSCDHWGAPNQSHPGTAATLHTLAVEDGKLQPLQIRVHLANELLRLARVLSVRRVVVRLNFWRILVIRPAFARTNQLLSQYSRPVSDQHLALIPVL
jgi:hypothetical protein